MNSTTGAAIATGVRFVAKQGMTAMIGARTVKSVQNVPKPGRISIIMSMKYA
jgi:hypothetical protein